MALLLCVAGATQARQIAGSGDLDTVDLTQADLFSLPGWQHRNVAVGGFNIGMTRSQAAQLAQAHGWVLRPDTPPRKAAALKGPCVESSCGVHEAQGNWIGLDLGFDAANHINIIKVSFPTDADPQVMRVNIVRQFNGLTREFFSHYSDDLRNRVLGKIEGKRRESAHSAPFAYVEYDYPSLGLVVHTTVDTRDNPAKPFDLEVDFRARQ